MGGAYREFASHESVDARLARLAARRHGVFSSREASGLGATKDLVRRRVAAARWLRMHAGVYRLAGTPDSWRQRLVAACLATGGAASHHAAASVWRITGFEPTAPEVTVPRGRRPRPHGILVHQLALPEVDVTVVDAIPVTTPARTLLDLAAVVEADVLEEALDDALRRGLVSVPRLRWRLEQLGRRPGVATMRRLVAARSRSPGLPQSVLETRFLRLVRRDGLPEPTPQYEVRDRGRLVAIVDFAYPAQMLAIEVDGYRWHSSRTRWQKDLRRRSELARHGWRMVHVTAEDLEHRAAETMGIIAQALILAP